MIAMASFHAMRSCVIAAGVLAATVLPVAVGSASAAGNAQTRGQAPLAVTVTSISPSYASPGQTLVIKGRVWNGSGSTMTDLSVGLSFSNSPFGSETALENFAKGQAVVPEAPLAGIASKTIGKLRSQHGVAWKISLSVSVLRLSCFGVYPLTVGVSDAAGTLTASDPVPLPFWPSKHNSCQAPPSPFLISWVWPLIDNPHQGPCTGLIDNSLAASLAPGGRLSNLLNVGADHETAARLTWAIDPALLDNAHTMTRAYEVGASADCTKSTSHTADANAKNWLSGLAKATAGQPVFVTSYADVDVAGLADHGDSGDLRGSFSDGWWVAARLLGRERKPAQVPAGPKQLSAVAWPAGGRASQAMLEYLGSLRTGTVILAMPPTQLTFTPGAVSSVVDGVGTTLKVLLADDSLSKLLASTAVNSQKTGTIFGVSQLFLAQTAMIVAEAPFDQRPIVVTPPRRWDPSRALAADLLEGTVGVPWLRPVTIGQLAKQPAGADSSLVQPYVHPELPRKVLRQINKLDHSVSLLQSIMPPTVKVPQLNRSDYSIESSAWVGHDAAQAQAMLTRTRAYVAKQFADLSVGGQSVIHVTLGGRVGSVTVSIHNSLNYAVRVGLNVTSSNNTVIATQRHRWYLVTAHSSQPLKLSVNATQTGKATLKLKLKSPNGTLLPDKPLIMTISATNLGTVALVIFAAALAVFVAASAAQAIRRCRPGTGEEEEPRDPAEPGPPSAGSQADRDRPTTPELTDNVFMDRSELSSVGHQIADQGSPPGHSDETVSRGTTGRRPTEESR
jgi:hypothetical protein